MKRSRLAVPHNRRLVHLTTTDMSLAWLLGPQLQAFAAAGFEVIGVSAPGPFVASLEADGIQHVALRNATRSMAPLHDVAAFGELIGVLRRLRPAILHTHNPKPGLYGRVAGRLTRTPVVVNTVHGLYATAEDTRIKRSIVYGLERIAAACSDGELVQNPEDVEVLAKLGVNRDRLHLLGNGIDLQRFNPDRFSETDRELARRQMGASPEKVVVGVVGRLVEEKGITEVIGAARRAQSTNPEQLWVLIGPTDDAKVDAVSAATLAEAEACGITVMGERSDIDFLYAGMDIFVLASHREGFPRAAMEASAMGLPVIATNIRGCRQVVDDGVTGRLVSVRDSGALGAAVTELGSNAPLRMTMGAAARIRARDAFNQQRVIDVTLALYEELLARESR